jgi:hypothetical protein
MIVVSLFLICFQILGQNTAKQNSSPPPLPTDTITPVPLPQPPFTSDEPELKDAELKTDFIGEYKTRLKHLGLYVEASTTESYHLFLKKLPNTTASITIQNPTSIFVDWSIFASNNEIWIQAKKIKAAEIPVTDTTISLTFSPPSPIKLYLEKNLFIKDDQVLYVQYIFPYEVEEDEIVDNAF